MSEYTSLENQRELLEALVNGVEQSDRSLDGILTRLDSVSQQLESIKQSITASSLRETIGRVTKEHDGLVPQLPADPNA